MNAVTRRDIELRGSRFTRLIRVWNRHHDSNVDLSQISIEFAYVSSDCLDWPNFRPSKYEWPSPMSYYDTWFCPEKYIKPCIRCRYCGAPTFNGVTSRVTTSNATVAVATREHGGRWLLVQLLQGGRTKNKVAVTHSNLFTLSKKPLRYRQLSRMISQVPRMA